MLTCKQFKLSGIILYLLYILVLVILDFNTNEPSYGVSLFQSIKLLLFEVVCIYLYCKKVDKII